jgi:hypothetical protein
VPYNRLQGLVQGKVVIQSPIDQAVSGAWHMKIAEAPPYPGAVADFEDPSEAVDDMVVGVMDVPVQFDVLDNDLHLTDRARSGTVLIVDKPSSGDLSWNEDTPQIISYRPRAGFIGDDAFSYRIGFDDGGGTDTATVSLHIIPPSVAADLELITVTDSTTINAGQPAICRVTVHNYGPGTATNCVLNFIVPADWQLVTVGQGSSTAGTNTPPLVIPFGALAPGAVVRTNLIFSPRVNTAALVSVSVQADTRDPNPGNNNTDIYFPAASSSTQATLFIEVTPTGAITLEFTGALSVNYQLQASTNLVDWHALQVLTGAGARIPVTGLLPSLKTQFYRAETLPP